MKHFYIRIDFPDKYTHNEIWQQIGLELDVKQWEKLGIKITPEND